MQHLIEFLIPAYKRLDGVAAATISVAEQVSAHGYENIVRVTVVDDASPGFSVDSFVNLLGDMASLVNISSNASNKGMSQNIYDMVSDSRAEFCTVLTDDDWLIDGKLFEIVEYLTSIADEKKIGGLFTPRYSYLETGELHCVVCKPFSRDRLIESGPYHAMKHCHDGFVLTGFIFRPKCFARKVWFENIENGYFPVINFGLILSRYSLLFVNRNWFHHTVLNVCHWESWGEDRLSQSKRLYRDYMDAVSNLADNLITSDLPSTISILVRWYETVNYLVQMRSRTRPRFNKFYAASRRTRQRLAFRIAVLVYPTYSMFHIGRLIIFKSCGIFKRLFRRQ